MANFLSRLFRRPKVSPSKTVGAPGTAIFGGYIVDNEKNQDLSGTKKFTTYANILANTSIVAAGTRYFLNLIAKADWTVDPVDDTPKARELAERVELIQDRMKTPWNQVIKRTATYRFYGYSWQEWTAMMLKEGFIGMRNIQPRPQRTIEQWDRDDHGEVFGAIQRSPQSFETIYLPRSKAIYIVDDVLNDSPEGLGLLRHVAEANQHRRALQRFEGIGFETDLAGIPIGRAPLAEMQALIEAGDLTTSQKNEILKPLRDFLDGHVRSPNLSLLLDSITYMDEEGKPSNVKQFELELLKSSSVSHQYIGEAIMRLDREIARVLGVEGLMLGDSGKGSFALSKDKSNNLFLIVDSTLTEIEQTYQQDFLDPLWRLNGWPEELKPRLKASTVQFQDIEQVTRALSDMAKAGAMLGPDDPAINFVRDLLGAPHAPEITDEDLEIRPTPPEPEPPDKGELEE